MWAKPQHNALKNDLNGPPRIINRRTSAGGGVPSNLETAFAATAAKANRPTATSRPAEASRRDWSTKFRLLEQFRCPNSECHAHPKTEYTKNNFHYAHDERWRIQPILF